MVKNNKIVYIIGIIVVLVVFAFVILSSSEYEGYYCNYIEDKSMRIVLEDDTSISVRTKIEDVINSFDNLSTFDYLPKETFIDEESDEAYDTYLVYFTDDVVDDYVEVVEELSGVNEVFIDSIKSNIVLIEFIDKDDYKYQNGLDVLEESKIKGKYEINENVINLENDKIYIKNDFLCLDEECTMILSKTDNRCE